ncbi:hypothetical protein NEMBOFW57_004467 [Staphylotrichum longicolle]|uniref:Ubiquitin-like domain-containing protein n=1 Tax=Staphylotrichum longicolle TaxID=669026 RepID=A0AAD4F7G8_9PEZI|nr:hypothetical protein NEMBOFW57_004467 [Staphylotrichum longicolle]
MTSAGEVIAILGLFERVAIELRNYKDAPEHFQHLGVELDLLRSTLRHALQLRPENDDERHTLDKVGAIATHCLQPLQALAEKMRAKESSLGHFRTTGSLVNIGTRVHWSLIARKDVDELRKVVLAEMVAINMLLSAQQLSQIKRLSSDIKGMESAQSALIEQHSSALIRQTSSILSIVTTTPNAIADLRAVTVAHAAKQSVQGQVLQRGLEAVTKHMEALSLTTKDTWAVARQHAGAMRRMVKRLSALMRDIRELFVFLATCSKEILAAIGRNTRLLLHIADQMKRVVQVIEAMPRSLGVDIIRLDDALGETWGLPLQACEHWRSFRDMLRHVVFAGKPGLDHVTSGRFVITLAKTGQRLNSNNWTEFMKRDVHIEQAMIVTSLRSKPTVPNMLFRPYGEDLPPMKTMGDGFEHFRRVQIQEHVKPIQNIEEATRRMAQDMSDATAHAFIGAEMLFRGELDGDTDKDRDDSSVHLREAEKWLRTAVEYEPDVAEHWYLLGRANYDECKTRPRDAIQSFQKCLELNPGLTQVEARLKILENWTYMVPAVQQADDHRIHRMLETKLRDFSDEEGTSEGTVRVVELPVEDDPGSFQNQELDER